MINGLGGLLSYLVFDGLGGSPITDMIAAAALNYGADCIVYPSARVDCGFPTLAQSPLLGGAGTWWI
jgi:hypothetical protein